MLLLLVIDGPLGKLPRLVLWGQKKRGVLSSYWYGEGFNAWHT
jgi:hypothetical protein